MAILFPTALDVFTNPTAADAMESATVPHATQHADVNDAVEALEAKVGVNNSLDTASLDYIVRNIIPAGMIMMWSGTIATIPSGWLLCDGTNGTPDLRDKFVVGATSDAGGVAKTNIEGSLKQTGGVTGHSHSGHANLTHAGGAVGDHTGLTHGVTIADHPGLTHAAITFPAATLNHADISVPSFSGSQAAVTLTHADHSVASFSGSQAAVTLTHADHSVASFSGTQASAVASMAASTLTPTLVSINTGVLTTPTAATRGTLSATTDTVAIASFTGTVPSGTHSHAAITLTHADHSVASASHTHAAVTLTHADHSVASASHTHAAITLTQAAHSLASSTGSIASHPTVSHAVTAPAAHGTAGTLTHSFTQPDDHVISAHDTVLSLPNYYALAYVMKS